MKILNQQLELLNSIHTITLDKAILITDSIELTQLASEQSLEVIQLPLADLNAIDWGNQIYKLKDKEVIVNGLGYHFDPEKVDFDSIKLYGDAYLSLLRTIKKLPQPLTLVSLCSSTPFLTALMDGLAKSLSKESPKLTYKSVRIPSPSNFFLNELLGTCLAHRGDQFLVKEGHLYRYNLIPTISEEKITSRLRMGGTYIITGGAGGVGRALCQYLVKKYRATVFLIGRKDLNKTLAAQLKESGAKSYMKADVGDWSSLSAAIKHVESVAKIDGLFHLAGSLRDALFDNITNEQLHQVLQPKVAGMLNLAQINKNHSLGFVCHFTSLSGLLGNLGQSTYAAANACVDSYTEYYNQLHSGHYNWMTINWGLWKTEGGMQMDDTDLLEPMDANEACLAMEQAIAVGVTTAIFKGSLKILEEPVAVFNKKKFK